MSAGGSVSMFGKFSVADLRGTWREMGRQYGSMLSGCLREAYEFAVEDALFARRGRSREAAEEAAGAYFANFPHRLRELVLGMAETSGLDASKHILLNAAEHLLASEADCPSGSTGIAVWGEYAASHLVYGRCRDFLPEFRELAEKMIAAVFHPADGSAAVASIGFPGVASLSAGMNEHGIFIARNNGEPSGGALRYHNRVPAAAALLAFMFDAANLDQFESFMFTTRSELACLVSAADDQTSRCYEWPVFDVKRRLSVKRPGLMVATNHFTEPSWGLPRPEDEKFGFTRTRRRNLLSLAEHFKGSIDAARMKKIMETRIDDLGASGDSTISQIVAVPGTMMISVRVPDRTDWTDIQLGDFLRPGGR